MKTDLFQSCGHCWVFQICWHIECSIFTASSFSIWNSSTEVPSPRLALFIVIFSKAHSTSHSRMSGSSPVITTSCYLGHVYLFYIILLCILSTSSYHISLLFGHKISRLSCAHLCMKCSLGISHFLEEVSSLSHSVVFLYFFALITGEGFLISPCYSLEHCIQMGISLLFSFAFSFSSFLSYLFGSKITADGDCSYQIKRRLLLGRKAMTKLDSILKSRNIALPTKAHLVKAMVFQVAMYGCESWTIKKAEHQRIDAFELWCWRRLFRIPLIARRSNQPILKEINPEYS